MWTGEGMVTRDAVDVVKKCGTCEKRYLPKNIETPEAIDYFKKNYYELSDKAFKYRFTAYTKVNDIETMKASLVKYGPMAIGMDWWRDITFSPDMVMLVAFFLYHYIKEYLFSPFTVAIGLFLGGLLLMFAEYRTKGREAELVDDVDKISIRQAVWVGIYQFLSLWPGFSRSGSTIAGGLLVGLTRSAAANYTFVIAVPLMFVACIYDLLRNLQYLSAGDMQVLAIGFVVSFIVAYISVLWFLKFLQNSKLTSFAVYRILLAGVTYWYFYM